MFCPNCGRKLAENDDLCPECGARIETAEAGGLSQVPLEETQPGPCAAPGEAWRQNATEAENAAVSGARVSPNIYRGSDGKYRWVYELSFKDNRSAGRIFRKVIAIVLGLGGIAVALLMLLLSLPDELDEFLESIVVVGPIWIAIFLGVELLSFPVMAIVSAAYKGSYWTMFEMDDREIVQIQLHKTFQRTQVMGLIFALTDDNLPDVMTSIRMAIKDRYATRFDSMRSVKLDRAHGLIDCSCLLAVCPVYTAEEDYEFVKAFITDHIAGTCRVTEA